MLEINLVPEEYKRTERTPLPRFVTIIVGVVLVAVGLVAVFFVKLAWLDAATATNSALEQRVASLAEDAKRYDELVNDITQLEKRRQVISDLWQKRVIWSRKLDELIDLVPAYVWVSDLNLVEPTRTSARRAARAGASGAENAGKLTMDVVTDSADWRRIADFWRILIGEEPVLADPNLERSQQFAADFIELGHDGGRIQRYDAPAPDGSGETIERSGVSSGITLFVRSREPVAAGQRAPAPATPATPAAR